MLPEQQQRILGYFIEEARDHLNTIEQGLLNLETTLNDPEMINEVFRAAHSIKGGSAMLGLSSIQHTSHRLEDCFKVLKENPVQVDQKLESLFLGVSDTLKALLENLSGPFGLSEETANTLMSETEPVFQWLNEHLELLVQQGNSELSSNIPATENHSTITELFLQRDFSGVEEEVQQSATEISAAKITEQQQSKENWDKFQTQVLQTLREMLQLFKQSTKPETRQNLQECCHQLVKLGEALNLPNWCSLCQRTANAIANPENTYLILAKIVITEIKQAQELVLRGMDSEIVISQQLETLLGFSKIDLLAIEQPTTAEPRLFSDTKNTITSLSDLSQQLQPAKENTAETSLFLNSLSGDQNDAPLSYSSVDSKGPEVGMAELNTLADLFEGETPELDETWHQEEILDINSLNKLGIDFNSSDAEDADSDLADFLLFDEVTNSDEQQTTTAKPADLNLLFGDIISEAENKDNTGSLSANSFNLSNISSNDINLDAHSDEILREFSQASHDAWQPPVEISPSDVGEDLLELEIDAHQPLFTDQVTQPETDSVASVELSTNPQSSFDDLFSEPVSANLVEGISHSKNIELNLNLSHQESLSLDSLFAEIEENTLLSTGESEIGDLFDIVSPKTTDFPDAADEQNNFWNEEVTAEKQHELDIDIEQDVAKELEESLLTAAADHDFFGDPQQSTSSPAQSFDLEDFNIAIPQIEQQVDLIFTSDDEDDLFADLTPSTSTISSAISDEESSLTSGLLLRSGDSSTTQPPETLDFIPEFTNQLTEIEFSGSPQSLSHQESDLFNIFDENTEQNSQVLFDDIEPAKLTHIQLDFPEHSIDDLLTAAIPLDVNVNETDDLPESLTETELSLDAAAESTEPEIIQSEELGLFDELLIDEPTNIQVNETADLPESLTETELSLDVAAESTEPEIIQSEELGLFDELSENEIFQLDTVSHQEELLTNPAIAENIVADDLNQETAFLLDEFEDVLDVAQINDAVSIAEEDAFVSVDFEVASTLTSEEIALENNTYFSDEFAELEALLEEELAPIPKETSIPEEDFAALEALLGGDNDEETPVAPAPVYSQQFKPAATQHNVSKVAPSLDMSDEFSDLGGDKFGDLGDEFRDLEKLLAEANQTISHSPSVKSNTTKIPSPSTRRSGGFEETMKVPVKQLDDMSNLVGELVVNRNTLEQDHERLRQSLDNLLIQVQQLSDVGARMQELYERSLLEASLLASRKNREIVVPSSDFNTDRGFSELEMDRFTPFHTLSQEMIEMIVRVRESASDIDFVTEETERVARQFRQVTTQLQEGLTRARMVPFSQAIDRLRRGIRDNAIKCGKQVELVVEGENTLIDKMILDHLTDPLTHMLNNAIAHGIETPEIRQAANKSPVGEITIRAFQQGNQTVISVGDDGAGIDPVQVKAKALKLGMITAGEANTMTRVDVYDLLFQSGFSIKDQADEISGRGVGMDVVRSEISKIRGTVNTDSAIGKGTTFTIRLPLTLSICKALCCVSDKARIAFPMDGVEDTLDIPLKNIQHTADGQSFISWRDTTLPFRPLKELLAFNRHISRGNVYGGNRDDDMVSVVVVRSANNLIALQIDLVLSEQEIVIKQFERPAPKPIGVAGATVLGDGRIMPIADVLEIMDIFQGRISRQSSNSWQQKNTPIDIPAVKIDPTVLIVDDSITVRELLSLTFNKAGYRVEQARDGQEAWDKLRSGLPCDIVFCDIEMPRCDGLELLSRIQKDSSLNHLPIAMLTSRGADKHRQMAIQLGASGYFTKPYLEEALLEAAGRMLKGEKLINSASV